MTITFSIEYKTRWGENLVLVSGEQRFPMAWNDGGIWTVEVRGAEKIIGEYGYELCEGAKTVRREWDSHHLELPKSRKVLEIRDSWIDAPAGCPFLRKHSSPAFDVPGFKGAGTAVPVFALRSAEDFGIGEFLDLKGLVDWAAATGQKIIQLLPINDTTISHDWMDSYPYTSCSSFALHPQFINLPAAGLRRTAGYKALQAELNALPQIDYVRVNAEKDRLLHKLFEEKGGKVMASADYADFCERNKFWLKPYAVFCALRDSLGTGEFGKWGAYAKYSAKKAEAYYEAHRAEVDYHCYVQYLADSQLKEVCAYARAKGVSFKGDLPIGVGRCSAEAWMFPKLFNMDSQCGAPPDAFAADGQNWGFPTYNWDEMAKDDYAWWKARLRKMAEYFDAFRIDHILGFFRIWEIPVPEKSGLMGHFSPALPYSEDEIRSKGLPLEGLFVEDPRKKGYWHPRISVQFTDSYKCLNDWQKWSFDELYNDFFYHRHNAFWKECAMKKIPALLGATGMLACGEDLGMIPACVPEVMSSQRILSLEIQRMSKDPSQAFARPADYPYLSVCTTSTHDMSPLRGWWHEEDRGLIQRFYNEVLGRWGEAPADCGTDICEQIVRDHLQSPAMLTILPVQDWLSMDESLRLPDPMGERINVPAICPYYWRYRMHLSVEQLLAADAFNAKVSRMIAESGR